jgi:hypothetical protein
MTPSLSLTSRETLTVLGQKLFSKIRSDPYCLFFRISEV